MNSDNSTTLTIGGEVKAVGMAVCGKLFVFTPVQMQFLLSLQKLKNATAAALSVGKDEAWGTKFLKSRKFTSYLNSKLDEYSVKTGLTPEYLIRWGKEAMEGFREYWQGVCKCGYENIFNSYEFAEQQDDDLEGQMKCRRCFDTIEVKNIREPFKPTREQMEAYKELKAAVIPKVERVHHVFSNEEIVFQSEGE